MLNQEVKSNKEAGRLDRFSCKGFQRLMELKYMRCAPPAFNPTRPACLPCTCVVPKLLVSFAGNHCCHLVLHLKWMPLSRISRSNGLNCT